MSDEGIRELKAQHSELGGKLKRLHGANADEHKELHGRMDKVLLWLAGIMVATIVSAVGVAMSVSSDFSKQRQQDAQYQSELRAVSLASQIETDTTQTHVLDRLNKIESEIAQVDNNSANRMINHESKRHLQGNGGDY